MKRLVGKLYLSVFPTCVVLLSLAHHTVPSDDPNLSPFLRFFPTYSLLARGYTSESFNYTFIHLKKTLAALSLTLSENNNQTTSSNLNCSTRGIVQPFSLTSSASSDIYLRACNPAYNRASGHWNSKSIRSSVLERPHGLFLIQHDDWFQVSPMFAVGFLLVPPSALPAMHSITLLYQLCHPYSLSVRSLTSITIILDMFIWFHFL